jgi:hypothetical protein
MRLVCFRCVFHFAIRTAAALKGVSSPSVAVIGLSYWGKNLVLICRTCGVGTMCDSDSDTRRALSGKFSESSMCT